MKILYAENMLRRDDYTFFVNGGGELNLKTSLKTITICFLNGSFHSVHPDDFDVNTERNRWRINKAIAEKIEEITARYDTGGGL